MTGAGLRLEARNYAGPARWRWVLTDAGATVAEHDVTLDENAWQFEAFTDLPRYLSWHVAPDKRAVDEPQIVRQAGEWVTASVLGQVAGALARRARRSHVTVEVIAPGDASGLLSYPFELAHVNGRPLAALDVTLVRQPGPDEGELASAPREPRERLRVLGLFSLPEGGQPLNLRRERQALTDLIKDISAAGKAAEVRTIQYGVTRDQLRDVLAEGDGWDIIHISGHGSPGELLLETADGQPDRVSAGALADLLEGAREHVTLVTIAACWSAALPVLDRHLGLEGQRPQDSAPERSVAPAAPPAAWGTLAGQLADRLGCAVLAMRYPVDDEFAIALSATLYDLLARHGQPLPRALATTLRRLADLAEETGQADGVPVSAMPLATPVLYGGSAVGLSLAAPQRSAPASYDTTRLKLAGFPPLPDRFVGRTGVMARASAALASRSGIPGVLLHGMPGGGKTSCALELAYGHAHSFDRLVWYKAPDEGVGIDGAAIEGSLTNFALTLERYLPGFQMAHLLTSQERLDALLPLLTELAEVNRFLIVIDNAESLLTDGGQWRDPQWGQVVGALTGHRGLGRLVLTSRRVPAGGAPRPQLRVESVDALSPQEALLLARELPDLRRLIYDELPGLDRETSRRLALGVMNVAQGHPKLLELANGQAAHPGRLAALIQAGDQAWREQGGLPDGFFATGDGTAPASGAIAPTGKAAPDGEAAPDRVVTAPAGEPTTAGDYWHVLAAWTHAVADTLTAGERDLFWFLCCLEEPDRERPVIDANWAGLRQRLARDEPPPGVDAALAALAARGLAAIQPETSDADESYAIHPGVAAAGRAQAGQPFRGAADGKVGTYWRAVHEQASGSNEDGSVDTGLMVRAGLTAIPYLVRLQQWRLADVLLYNAFLRDHSRVSAV